MNGFTWTSTNGVTHWVPDALHPCATCGKHHERQVPIAAPDPLAGPFMAARQLTDYSDEPGYAIRLP